MWVKSPSGQELLSQDEEVEARPWVSVVFDSKVKIRGGSGRYGVEAALWEGSKPLVRREDYFTVVEEGKVGWPGAKLAVFDVDRPLEPYLQERGIAYEKFSGLLTEPKVIVVSSFTALWRNRERFREFLPLSAWSRGAVEQFSWTYRKTVLRR